MNLIEEIISTIEHWQKHLLITQEQDQARSMADMEQAAQCLGQRIAQLALTHLLYQSGTGYDRCNRNCQCGNKQRFERFSERTVRTMIGETTYKRAYYRCRSCGASCFPLDEQIHQSGREVSPGVERAVALLSAHLSFAQAERVLVEVTGVKLSARQIETIAESIGAEAELLQQQEQRQAAKRGLDEVGGPNQPPARTFIVEMDGVQVGLQDGSWQEAKCGVIYELSQRVEINPGRWELLKRQRCVIRGDVQSFRMRLWALCLRAGLRQQDRVVVIGDGAEWIDHSAALLFPKATRILDYYHAAQRVWAVANARFGEGSKQAKNWAQQKQKQMKAGEIGKVIVGMSRLKMAGGEGARIREEAVKYIKSRQEQMEYGSYQREGLPIGSGAIESTCKHMVTTRCKQAGMRWSEAGVDAMLALRSFVLNERLDEVCTKPALSFDWRAAA